MGTQPLELEKAIGQRLREIREGAGVPRELLVEAGRLQGLPWSVATITLIESGRRRIPTGELLLVPHTLTTAIPREDRQTENHRPYRLSDLVPEPSSPMTRLALTLDSTGRVVCDAPPSAIRALIEAHGVRVAGFEQENRELFTTQLDRERPYYDEVTLRISRSMGMSFRKVAQTASELWQGRTFLQERDERLKSRLPEGASARKIQATRGHVSRGLMQELENHLKKQKGGVVLPQPLPSKKLGKPSIRRKSTHAIGARTTEGGGR